ncbi:hypothetical protein BCY86_01730 [Pajaroellobacter abortibovis]|uniref:Glycosyltransferase RgtA/B/C/D-like domain-containing protein n=2 Tax=Pajaroellobacter abortibovis TaxID=1882918 RepID=A0A1L6MVK8_9BACT|nr:hypothetical protein BCY86_01730 [Pajaroellobacter abortibovis]
MLLKLAGGGWLLSLGFSHVSDDDYARIVIAQKWVARPTLDPSGTSWLPFPFWIMGGLMMLADRTLQVARIVSIGIGTIAPLLIYGALRARHFSNSLAFSATCIGMLTPWNAWLGVCPVPEGLTGALLGTALLLIDRKQNEKWVATCLLIASLSRYEAWPLCLLFAILHIPALFRTPTNQSANQQHTALCILLSLSGPLSWIAWNAYTHTDPFHFLHRVTMYRQLHTSLSPVSENFFLYPQALWQEGSWLLLWGATGIPALAVSSFRKRWIPPLITSLAWLFALSIAEARDQAPTHHPIRPLIPLFWVLAAFGADGLQSGLQILPRFSSRGMLRTVSISTAILLYGLASLKEWQSYPGATPSEDREHQIQHGYALRGRQKGAPLLITPCFHEHFALLAAYGAPEEAVVNPPSYQHPPSGAHEACPQVISP